MRRKSSLSSGVAGRVVTMFSVLRLETLFFKIA
jgi:hypothetical protein